MPVDTFNILTLIGLTIIVGYAGSLIFHKTRIPDVIWLLLFGLLVGPVLSFVNTSMYIAVSPLLAAVAIVIILFDAGLNMDFYQTVKNFSRSMLLSVAGIGLSMLSLSALSVLVFGLDPLTGALLGAILGGTSFPVVESIIKSAKVRESVRSLLSIESIITDPLVIVISIAIMGMLVPSIGSHPSALKSIMAAFSIGAVVGLFAGFIWLHMLRVLKGKPFDYMLTLGVLFLLYVFVEAHGGSGAIASLIFGLVLGNAKTFTSMLRIRKHLEFDENMKRFQSEVTFLMKSFFFVFLGIIVIIKPQFILYGFAAAMTLIVLRFAIARIGMHGMRLSPIEKDIMRITVPRGLAAAVLAQYPINYGIPGAEMISSIVFVVILATVIYATAAVKIATFIETRKKAVSKKDVERVDDVVSFVKNKSRYAKC